MTSPIPSWAWSRITRSIGSGVIRLHAHDGIGLEPDNPFYWIRGFDVWVPEGLFVDQKIMNRETRYLAVIARLAPSATRAQAQTEMEAITSRLADEFPQSNKDVGVTVVGLAELFTVKG